jgi:outer membrane protein assembly factor BamB
MTFLVRNAMRAVCGGTVAALLVAGAAAGSSPVPVPAASGAWPQEGFGPGRTYDNPNETVINAYTIHTMHARWARTLNEGTCGGYSGRSGSGPLVSGGLVFVADGTGITALRAATGRLLWHRPAPTRSQRIALAGGRLLVATTACRDRAGTLLAVDPATGARRWHRTLSDVPMESLVADAGVAVVSGTTASPSSSVTTAFNVSDGTLTWRRHGYVSPGVSAAGRVILNRPNRPGLLAVSVRTGATLWRATRQGRAVAASPAGDLAYVDSAGTLSCLRATSGAAVWSAAAGGGSVRSDQVATDAGRVYYAVVNGMAARHARTGRLLWVTDLEADAGPPSRAGGLLYAKNEFAGLAVLNPATGRAVPAARPGSFLPAGTFEEEEEVPPVVVDGRLYLLSAADRTLRMYEP